MPKILIEENGWTLKDIGHKIINKYSNAKFLFEIDFSRDDYLHIKNLFQKDAIRDSFFENSYLRNYFMNNKEYRLPFLIFIAGFIRYEYLNDENPKNFYENFLKTLNNSNAKISDFQCALVDCFFKRSSKERPEGLFIYEHKIEKVSLPLESAGDRYYINSLIFHSGGIYEKCLDDYFKIIKKLSDECKEIDHNKLRPKELFLLYKKQNIKIYESKLVNFFEFLNTDEEIANYINEFVLQSISIFLKHEDNYSFNLPLYIKNYLLFNGIYGDKIEDIFISEADFIYENENIYFNPNFLNIYREISSIAFNINNNIYKIPKEYDFYTGKDFEDFKIKVPSDFLENSFIVELLIDDNLFRRFHINLFKYNFILINSNFCIKKILNHEIYIPKKEEGEEYIIISKNRLLNFALSDKKMNGYYLYRIPLNGSCKSISVENKIFELYFSPKLLTEIEYIDDEKNIYFSKLPSFELSESQKNSFTAEDLLNNKILNFQEFYEYNKPIGKFFIDINSKKYRVVFILNFKILKWFNWYEKSKQIRFKISKDIKTNADFADKNEYIFDCSIIDELNYIELDFKYEQYNIGIKILPPKVELLLLDKKKRETKLPKQDIKFETINDFMQLKVKLINFPPSIKFDYAEIEHQRIDIIPSFNNYYISICEIKKVVNSSDNKVFSITLKNNYALRLRILGIINFIKKEKNIVDKSFKDIIVYDVNFLLGRKKDIRYIFKGKPYIIEGICKVHEIECIELIELRKTQSENKFKKPISTIEKDGITISLKDIDYE